MLNDFVTREMRFTVLSKSRTQALPGPHMDQKSTEKVQQLLERDGAVESYSLKLLFERLGCLCGCLSSLTTHRSSTMYLQTGA